MSLSRQQRRAQERAQQKADRREWKTQPATPAASSSLPSLSTGPRTPEGKAVSSRNALRHGLTAAALILPWENQADFDHLLNQLNIEHNPKTVTETMFVHEMAEQWWRLQRARNEQHSHECRAYELALEGGEASELESMERILLRVRRYATTHERGFHRAHRMLRTLPSPRTTNFLPSFARFLMGSFRKMPPVSRSSPK
jgi:hypothetical protein